MLQKITILTISLITLFLTGCTTTSSFYTSTTTSTNTSSDTDTSTASNVSGKVLKFSKGGSSFDSVDLSSNTNIKQIIVGGETISVSPTGVSSGTTVKVNNNIYGGTLYTDSRFGFVLNADGSAAYLYAQGNITDSSSMPTTGTATYSGNAVLAQINNSQLSTGTAGVTLNVDFGNKNLTGTVKISDSSSLTLAANISGSTFSGTSDDSTYVNG